MSDSDSAREARWMRRDAREPDLSGQDPSRGDFDHGACAWRYALRRALTESEGPPADCGTSAVGKVLRDKLTGWACKKLAIELKLGGGRTGDSSASWPKQKEGSGSSPAEDDDWCNYWYIYDYDENVPYVILFRD